MTKHQQTLLDRINHDFSFGMPRSKNAHHDCEAIRSMIGLVALDLVRICPQSRELNGAINKLDEAVFWAQAAIDRHGVSFRDPDVEYTE